MGGQKLLNHTCFFHIRSHLFIGGLCHLVIHLVHLLFQLKEKRKGRCQCLPDGHAFFQFRVLVEVTNAHIFGPFYFSLIRLQLPGDNAHKCGFSLAIGSDKTNMLTFEQTERYILKNSTVAKSMA